MIATPMRLAHAPIVIALGTLVACSGSRFQSTGSGGAAGSGGGAAGSGGAAGASGSGAQPSGGGTAGSGGTSPTGGTGGTGATGGASGTGGAAGAGGSAGACPTNLKGPAMVKIDAQGSFYCVDKTEVDAGQYDNFLSAVGKPQQPAYCAFNTNFTPTHGWPAAGTKLPVVGVDWCDAWTYCKWAGKRLCGQIGGGSSPPGNVSSTLDQWFTACSHSGSQTYPYGNNYSGTACNGSDNGIGAAVAVGSKQTCQGGYSGLYDMSGNVSEWVDACEGYTGADDSCQDRSGSYMTDQNTQACGYAFNDKRSDSFDDVGFRCCWDPT